MKIINNLITMNMRRLLQSMLMFATLIYGINITSAQTYLVNDNSYLVVSTGVRMLVDGSFINQNGGLVDNNDTIFVTGDWTNNAANNVFVNPNVGTIVLKGTTQDIMGTYETWFNNLVATGGGVKTLGINSRVKGILTLNDEEIDLDTYDLYVDNASASAITRASGYVNTTSGGWLTRAVNAAAAYLYPVGTSTLYRPVDMTPTAATADSFGVRLFDFDPTLDGYDAATKHSSICEVNQDYYHQIKKGNGGLSQADVTIYFDSLVDGGWDYITHWQNIPQWENTSAPSFVYQTSPLLSSIKITAWNLFNPYPFSLGRAGYDATINPVAPVCGSVPAFDLTAATAGGAWSGIGITDTVNGTFDPSIAGSGTHIITYEITSLGGCVSNDTVQIIVDPAAAAPSAPAGNISVCGNTIENYTSSAVGATGYIWTLSNGTAGVITGSGTSVDVTWSGSFSGSVNLCVAAYSGCDTSAPVCTAIDVTAIPGTPASPHGPSSVCQGTDTSTFTTSATPVDYYIWTVDPVSAGVTVGNTGQGKVAWDPAFSGNVTVYVYAATACDTSAPASIAVTVNADPQITSAAAGATAVCASATEPYNTVASDANGYVWTLDPPSAGSVVGTGDNVDVVFDPAYSGNVDICVYAFNNCDTTTTSCIAVNVAPLPTAGFSHSYAWDSASFTNTSTDAVSYQWSFGDGSTDTATNPTYHWTWDGNYTVQLIAINACGNDTTNTIINVVTTDVAEYSINELTVYPNPFDNSTNLTYSLNEKSSVKIELFDVTGRLLKVLDDDNSKDAGNYKLNINESDFGRTHGVYMLRVTINQVEIVKHLIQL